MGYEHGDRRYPAYPGPGGERAHRDRGERDYSGYGAQGGYRGERRWRDRDGNAGRYARHDHDDNDRGLLERAGDEVRSWFGDDDAERRAGYDRDRGFSAYGGGWAAEYGLGDIYSYGDLGYGAGRWDERSDEGRRRESHARHDATYRSWRDRQMEAFDRDYEEYRRENQSRFDAEFASWRHNRQGQRELLRQVREHQEVVGSDGQHVGTVDHVRGDHIRLTRGDQDASGRHHSIPCSWVQSVDDKVTLTKTADQARQHWREDQRDDGSFARGGHNLNRSFPGTY